MPAAVESMFSVKLVPWHREGIVLDEAPTSEEAIIHAGLNWPVHLEDLYWNGDNGQELIPNRKGLCRTLTQGDEHKREILAVVSNQYKPLQNEQAFGFFDELVQNGYASYETAGSLLGGRKIWVLAKLNIEAELAKNDVIRSYVLLCNGHDGKTGILVQPTPIRVVCNNTLQMSLGYGQVIKIEHRGDLASSVTDAMEMLGATTETFREIYGFFGDMTRFTMSEDLRVEYIKALIPDANITASARVHRGVTEQRDKIHELLYTGQGHEVTNKMSLWALYNAAIEFVDWYMGKRAKDRAYYQLFGRGAAMKQRAIELARCVLNDEPLSDADPEQGYQTEEMMMGDEG